MLCETSGHLMKQVNALRNKRVLPGVTDDFLKRVK